MYVKITKCFRSIEMITGDARVYATILKVKLPYARGIPRQEAVN
jgi:hypothetical protein